jgi:hypothetical protein
MAMKLMEELGSVIPLKKEAPENNFTDFNQLNQSFGNQVSEMVDPKSTILPISKREEYVSAPSNIEAKKEILKKVARTAAPTITPTVNTAAKVEEPKEDTKSDEKGKDVNREMVSAFKDLGSTLGGPSQVIDTGRYSTFQPEDTMGDVRRQVLQAIANRG